MLRRLRENGPGLLVPLAWTFVTLAHLDVVTVHTLLIAHVVMDVILVAFTALSWSDMQDGVLFVWKVVLLIGLVFTLAGTAGLATTPSVTPLVAVSIYGWMLLPAGGLVFTGREVDRSPRVYLAGAALSVVGTVVYAAAAVLPAVIRPTILGLSLVNLGQTAGILVAVADY